MDAHHPDQPRTVIVIAGAGARGAYEAGALAEILPAICPEGLGNAILLGTSAGAINATLWAARATEGKALSAVGDEVKAVWQTIRRDNVYKLPLVELIRSGFAAVLDTVQGGVDLVNDSVTNIAEAIVGLAPSLFGLPSARELVRGAGGLSHGLTGALFGAAGSSVAHPLASTGALLDTSPLREIAPGLLRLDDLHQNVREGRVAGVGVVATSCPRDGSGGRSRVFLHLRDDVPSPTDVNDGGAIDYVLTPRLEPEHVLASAAIPIVFPPIKIERPERYAGWHTDGGVRLNAPIEPAIKLGADRVVVISSHATKYPDADGADAAAPRPEVLEIGAQAIHVTLADGMIEDLRSLRRINKIVQDAAVGAAKAGSRIELKTPGGRPYRRVEVLEVAPDNGVLAGYAADVAKDVHDALDGLLLRFFARFGGSSGRNELLSYLLFEPTYYAKQFEEGARNARKALLDTPAFATR